MRLMMFPVLRSASLPRLHMISIPLTFHLIINCFYSRVDKLLSWAVSFCFSYVNIDFTIESSACGIILTPKLWENLCWLFMRKISIIFSAETTRNIPTSITLERKLVLISLRMLQISENREREKKISLIWRVVGCLMLNFNEFFGPKHTAPPVQHLIAINLLFRLAFSWSQ